MPCGTTPRFLAHCRTAGIIGTATSVTQALPTACPLGSSNELNAIVMKTPPSIAGPAALDATTASYKIPTLQRGRDNQAYRFHRRNATPNVSASVSDG